ncbi:unnamed protein product [Closterium sp. Naga37s-1]|nr:unnamed protein product [Closterium sp. Naga37s-1]
MASTNSNAGGVEGNNSHADLEASVLKIDMNNMDEEMDEKEPAENSPAKDPPAAENSKEQEEESQEDDIELEGEETMFRPAPRADPPANSASGRTNPSRSGGVAGDPGPSTQRAAEPNTQFFCSLPITLPPFIHGKTDVAAWLSMMTDLFKAHKVHDVARVVAATTVLDQNAQRVVYGSKLQAEADRKPFGWEEFASAFKHAFQVQPTQLEVRSRLEKLQCGNRTVQQYAMEFEEIWVLQKPAERMSEGEKIHLFFKGLPEHL